MGFTFGLTGGIASGKSTVSRVFASRGVAIVDADVIAREVVEPGKPALAELVEAFGTDILDSDGRMDRKKVGAMVFADPSKRATLDSVIGPHLLMECLKQVEEKKKEHKIVCFDAPLLVEKGLFRYFRPIVVVYCAVETQILRMKNRNGFTEEEARQRLAAQASTEDRLKYADYIISTDNTMDETKTLAFQVLDFIIEEHR